MNKIKIYLLVFGAFACIFSPINVHALIAGNDVFGIDFRFNNPGARANGMGGAFIGLADDATAAYTNPAGLTVLTQPEISAEYKYGDYTNLVIDQMGETEYDDAVYDVSFLSFVYPQDNVTVALYRHKFLDMESKFLWHENDVSEVHINEVDVNIDAITLGAGLGLKLTDTFSLGLAVGFDTTNYRAFNTPIQNSDYKETVNDSDAQTHYTASMLWNPFGEFNLGLVYREGPEYMTRKLRYTDEAVPGDFVEEFDLENTLKVPDIYGLGLSYRFGGGFTCAFDVNYIEYSDLLDGLVLLDGGGGGPQAHELEVDDVCEVHVGLEYILDINDMPLAVRCGYFFKPDHRIIYDGPITEWRNILKEGDDDNIYSLGLGAVVSDNVQIDVAGSTGDTADEFTISVVYRYD